MKKTLLAGGLAALMLAAAAGAAFAQQPPARGMRADADGDRRLSQAEFVGQRVQRLTTADTNRDGSVTADERRAAMQASRAGRADARFDRLDANDDGSVSRAEFDAARSAAREVRAERGPRPMGAHRGPARGQRGMGRMEARGPVVITEVQARAEQASPASTPIRTVSSRPKRVAPLVRACARIAVSVWWNAAPLIRLNGRHRLRHPLRSKENVGDGGHVPGDPFGKDGRGPDWR